MAITTTITRLEINALNTEWDLLLEKPYRDGGPAVDAWEIAGLKTATHVNGKLNDPEGLDESWTVEFAFPWKVLAERAHRPSPPTDGDRWRVNFSRVEWEHLIEGKAYKKVPKTPEANWVWSPQGAIDMHRPERWGFVQFSSRPPGESAYEPDPSLMVRDRLMAIYHAQKAYHTKNKAWASKLEDLDLPPSPLGVTSLTSLKMVPNGFEAEITIPSPSGTAAKIWTIGGDSRLDRKN